MVTVQHDGHVGALPFLWLGVNGRSIFFFPKKETYYYKA